MNRVPVLFLFLAAIAMLSIGCDGFFGKKTNPGFIDEPQFDDQTVAYVPIQPVTGWLYTPCGYCCRMG